MKFTSEDFKQLGIVGKDKFLPYINKYCKQFNVNTPNRIKAFFMNVLHESANLHYVKEIHDGSNYEGRRDLGNIQKGDGKRYSGSGISQTTGRANFRAFTTWCRSNVPNFTLDFEKNPELVQQDEWAVLTAFWFWKVNKLEAYADKADFTNVCSIWNTGKVQNPNKPHKINGLEDRIKKFNIIEQWLSKVIKGS